MDKDELYHEIKELDGDLDSLIEAMQEDALYCVEVGRKLYQAQIAFDAALRALKEHPNH